MNTNKPIKPEDSKIIKEAALEAQLAAKAAAEAPVVETPAEEAVAPVA